MKARSAMTLVLATVAAFGAACASGTGGGGSVSGSVITGAQLEETPFTNAYEVLDRHNLVMFQGGEMYLRGRGETSFQARPTALLVVNGTRIGGSAPGVLQGIEKSQIQRIEILRPSEAAQRFGLMGEGGAVILHLE